MNISVKSAMPYVCARLCAMVLENIPEKELGNVQLHEELLNLIEKNIHDFVAPKVLKSTMQSVAKRVNDLYQSRISRCRFLDFHPQEAHKKTEKHTHHADRSEAAVKINQRYTISLNKIICKKHGLNKFHYVEASLDGNKLTFVFFEKYTPGLLYIGKTTRGARLVHCRDKLFRNSTLIFEQNMKNMRLPYKFVNDRTLEIKLPPQQ